jgi:hypothetical protein
VRVEFYIGARTTSIFPKSAGPTGNQGHWLQEGVSLGNFLTTILMRTNYTRSSNSAAVDIYLRGVMRILPLVQSKVSLNLTALRLQSNLVQLVLIEDVHATRHESKVCISIGNSKDTEQNTFRVPAVILHVSSLCR